MADSLTSPSNAVGSLFSGRQTATDRAREMVGSLLSQQGANPALTQQALQGFDGSQLSDDAVQELSGQQGAAGAGQGHVQAIINNYVNKQLHGTQAVQPTGSAGPAQQQQQHGSTQQSGASQPNGQNGPNGAGGSQQNQKQQKVRIYWEPMTQAGQIDSPGSPIGKINVQKEQDNSGQQAASSAGQGQGADGGGTGGGSGSGGGVGAVSGTSPTSGSPGGQNGRAQLDAQSATAVQALQAQGQGNGLGSITSGNGNSVSIPDNGGTLKTKNWQQESYVAPGQELTQTTMLDQHQNLDNAPSQVYFSAGQSGSQVANDLQRNSDPNDPSVQNWIRKLKNPTGSSQN